MSTHNSQGWLPIDIDLDAEPAMVSDSTIHWMRMAGIPLREPFFEQTVVSAREATPPPAETCTSDAAMLRMASQLPPAAPAGFIFHISHCGSTLLSNALKEGKDSTVISESVLIAKLLRSFDPPASPYLAQRWERIRHSLLEAVFRLFANHRTGSPDRLVIKFPSINLHRLKVLRKHWPETPCVIVVRHPAEVMVSSLADRGWLAVQSKPEVAREMFRFEESAPSPEKMSEEEYCARIAGRLMASALEQADANCRIIDYEDLNTKRIREIAHLFGIELPPDRESIDRVFQWYAKDPMRKIEYTDDRARKKRMTTPAITEAARRWAMPAYAELRARDQGF